MPNRKTRRMLKARERSVDSFSKRTKANLMKQIQTQDHRAAVKRKVLKRTKNK